jgi:uncharacterized protein YabN with tetrapyrrole methylase and pyrophosphatase domain
MSAPSEEGRAPADAVATGEGLVEFLSMMRLMRERCEWKASQDHVSLAPYLREESAEVIEAIAEGAETGDWAHLADELGDLLLQVYFHAAVAEEAGTFTMDDVIAGLIAKMRRRNPHVFDPAYEGTRLSIGEIESLWAAAKAAERQA